MQKVIVDVIMWLLLNGVRAEEKSRPQFGRGDGYGWKPSSNSNLSIRALRAYPLVEIRQTVCQATVPSPHLTSHRPCRASDEMLV